MDLTNDDVADILALLDSLPYDSLDIETPRFRLTLRRAPGGGWTQESQVLSEPALVTPAPDAAPASFRVTPDISETPGRAGQAGTARATGVAQSRARSEASGNSAASKAAGTTGTAATRTKGAADGTAGATGSAAAEGVPADADGLAAVAAPLPGTFYRAPRPGAEPFVRVGDEVAPDTVVAIVETMKLMNSVHAGVTGRVARI
ncbi:MAG: acetyl-CoA carboxylase biotin carboxyl carrier protein, partial [Trebonia sp.]